MSNFLEIFMFVRTATLAVAAVGYVLVTTSTDAATMTFDGKADFSSPYQEDGITATANGDLGSFNVQDAIHLDDLGTTYPNSVTFSMQGRFNALSFDLLSSSFSYYRCFDPDPEYVPDYDPDLVNTCESQTYDNVRVSGYRSGTLVSLMSFDMSVLSGVIDLGSVFSNLDTFVIGFNYKPQEYYDQGTGWRYFCGAPCSHFNIDNVTLAPVPLPASIIGMALGVLALLSVRRRQRLA